MRIIKKLLWSKRTKLVRGKWYQNEYLGKRFVFRYNPNSALQEGFEFWNENGILQINQVKQLCKRKSAKQFTNLGLLEMITVTYMRRNFDYGKSQVLKRTFEFIPKEVILESNNITFDAYNNTMTCGKYIVMKNFNWSEILK